MYCLFTVQEWVMGMSKEQQRLQKHEEDPLMSEEHVRVHTSDSNQHDHSQLWHFS